MVEFFFVDFEFFGCEGLRYFWICYFKNFDRVIRIFLGLRRGL